MSAHTEIEERVIRPRSGLIQLDFRELWQYRELFVFLTWRDILIRYKQTYLGVAWAVFQPLLTVAVSTLVFSRLAKMDSNGAPYPILVLAGQLPWQFFQNAMTESSSSLVASSRIISKVYFPRLIIPLSAVLSGILDAAISVGLLLVMLPIYHVPYRPQLLLLPLFFGLAFLAACSVGIWFSALNVRYRDVRYLVPFIARVGMFICPVGYLWQSRISSGSMKFWYGSNPLVGIIDGFRWCILSQNEGFYWPGFWIGTIISVVLFVSGLFYFRNTERNFADLV